MDGALGRAQAPCHLEAVEVRHLHVEQDGGEVVPVGEVQRLLARGGGEQRAVEVEQYAAVEAPVLGKVVDDEDEGFAVGHVPSQGRAGSRSRLAT